MKKKLGLMILVMMMLETSAFAMAHRPTPAEQAKIDRVNTCLQATNNCWVPAPEQTMGKRMDDKCVMSVYCTCYTAEHDTNLMGQYCK